MGYYVSPLGFDLQASSPPFTINSSSSDPLNPHSKRTTFSHTYRLSLWDLPVSPGSIQSREERESLPLSGFEVSQSSDNSVDVRREQEYMQDNEGGKVVYPGLPSTMELQNSPVPSIVPHPYPPYVAEARGTLPAFSPFVTSSTVTPPPQLPAISPPPQDIHVISPFVTPSPAHIPQAEPMVLTFPTRSSPLSPEDVPTYTTVFPAPSSPYDALGVMDSTHSSAVLPRANVKSVVPAIPPSIDADIKAKFQIRPEEVPIMDISHSRGRVYVVLLKPGCDLKDLNTSPHDLILCILKAGKEGVYVTIHSNEKRAFSGEYCIVPSQNTYQVRNNSGKVTVRVQVVNSV